MNEAGNRADLIDSMLNAALAAKRAQMAALQNGVRHSRAVGEVVRMEGEAAIVWFKQVLNK